MTISLGGFVKHSSGSVGLCIPIFLGSGLRLFEDFGVNPVQLERLSVVNLPLGQNPFQIPGFVKRATINTRKEGTKWLKRRINVQNVTER